MDRHAHLRQIILNLSGAFVAITILATMAFIAWALVYQEIPKGNETTLVQFVGALQALAGLIVGYYFGSSHTNKQQSETLAHMAEATRSATQTSNPTPSIPVAPGDSVTVRGEE